VNNFAFLIHTRLKTLICTLNDTKIIEKTALPIPLVFQMEYNGTFMIYLNGIMRIVLSYLFRTLFGLVKLIVIVALLFERKCK